jgi:hypothetical protein
VRGAADAPRRNKSRRRRQRQLSKGQIARCPALIIRSGFALWLPASPTVVDAIGYLLTNRCRLDKIFFDGRIFGLFS